MNEEHWFRVLRNGAHHYDENLSRLKELLVANRGYVWERPVGEDVILLLSGGMDSVVLADVLLREWDCRVVLMHFLRGARSQKWEEASFDYFCDFYRNRYPKQVLDCVKVSLEVPLRLHREFMDSARQKVMGLPLRNATMWFNAMAQAVFLSGKWGRTIRTVVTGSVGEDDTSPESGLLAVLAATVATCCCLGMWTYQVSAPFIDGTLGRKWTKVDVIEYSENHSIPLDRTRSCFEDNSQPCGKCLGCTNRDKAFSLYAQRSAT
ncbi:MAG: 7-cyano-7-deazaguanine synthase [Candidatus Thorarchaeota archaeon]|nr:7-cyano-7-deazaguanine synthase [Candidatus Thorarchaeota archaeon]